MKNKSLEQLQNEYMSTPIPTELDFIVKKALKEGGVKKMKNKKNLKRLTITAASTAAAVVILTAGVNTSPVFADTLSKVPILNSIVKVLTFREYTINDATYHANIKTPAVQGLDNSQLQNSLNEKYLKENTALYDQFMTEIEDLKKAGGGHLGVDSGYIVKTDNESILSIGRYVVNTVGSSSTTFKYDTIDKKNQVLITLPSLFKDDSYIELISQNIKAQMAEQMKADESKFYWLNDEQMENFDKIKADQSFYISDAGQLVISFDKYEVAPGYMGVVEFVIPSDILSDAVVGNEYIK